MLWPLLLATTSSAFYTNEVVIEFANDINREQLELFASEHELNYTGAVLDKFHQFTHRRLKRRSDDEHDFEFDHQVKWHQRQRVKSRQKRDFVMPTDPLWKDMWYMNPDYVDKGEPRNQLETRHMNVTFAWQLGYTGRNVVVSILDDGIEMEHPDLKANYDKEASWDVNSNDDDPTPHYNTRNNRIFKDITATSFNTKQTNPPITESLIGYTKEINRHGTRCAGQVGATANNNVCVPGIAYNAKVGGVRMLDGDVTDAVEAKSIGHNQHHVDIYSASWGPDDDGRTVDGPARLAIEAFEKGAKEGRGGKGNIFVWASGNGGRYDDNCNCDGYTNSIYTVSISSTSEKEEIPWYSEQCVSTIASTYSSGTSEDKKILTTDLRGFCTQSHTGTSASAPIAAAILALTLEANSELTWREVQHLVITTSKKHNLKTREPDQWRQNGVGRWFSARYGYGLMDAGALVVEAVDWAKSGRRLPSQKEFTKSVVLDSSLRGMKTRSTTKTYRRAGVEQSISGQEKTYSFEIDTANTNGGTIDRLEHVTCVVSAKVNGRRGNVRFFIQSPSGTKSMLLTRRSRDSTTRGFDKFAFMTMELWDEKADGEWKFITDSADHAPDITFLQIVIRGTVEMESSESDNLASTSTNTSTATEANKGVTVEIRGSTVNASTSKVTTTKQVTSEPVTEHLQQTTERVESKVVGVSDTHVLIPSYNAGHTGLMQLVVFLVLGVGAFYASCRWFINQKNTKKYQLIPTVDRS